MIFLDSVESTHIYLKKYIKVHGYKNPLTVITQFQKNGIGSRDNSWKGNKGNLYFSFVIKKELLPFDLPIQSSSIYFSYILKSMLSDLGSKVWLKWPNDFYINEKKIGGTITNISNDLFFCGIGINLNFIHTDFGYLDINLEIKEFLNNYFQRILEKKEWKQIFSKYLIEFNNSKQYKTTINHEKISLKDAILNKDGSINIENKKVFSLR